MDESVPSQAVLLLFAPSAEFLPSLYKQVEKVKHFLDNQPYSASYQHVLGLVYHSLGDDCLNEFKTPEYRAMIKSLGETEHILD